MEPKLLNRQAALTMVERQTLLHMIIGYMGNNAEFERAMTDCLDSIEAMRRNAEAAA